MSAQEFEHWKAIFSNSKPDEDGDDPEGDLAWRAMEAIVERLEHHHGDIEDAARELAPALPWAAFWLSLGAVLVALIIKLSA